MALEGNLNRWNLKCNPDTKALGTTLAELTFDRNDFKGLNKKTFYVYNAGPGTLLSAVVEVSPDGAKWGTIDGTSFAGLGSGKLAYGWYDSSYRWWRFRARSNQAGTTIDGTVYAPGTTVDGTVYGGTVLVSTISGWFTF